MPIDIELADWTTDLADDVDVHVREDGRPEHVLPAFQAGDGSIRFRVAPFRSGTIRYETRSPDPNLDGIRGAFDVHEDTGQNELLRRGRLQVAANGRYLEHVDGRPFLWIGDTWWMGLGTRVRWPDEFETLVDDRVAKGFTVVQIVAGPLPEFLPTPEGVWHPQQANEGGWPWDRQWDRLNPKFFDAADQRIVGMVERGIVPCIVGMWGFYANLMGEDRVRRHWRHLVARYAAYPVVFCIAGEVNLPPYGMAEQPADNRSALTSQVRVWTSMLREVRRIDPYKNPLTAHPAYPDSREILDGASGLNLNMLQTSHWSYNLPSAEERRQIDELLGLPRPVRLGLQGALSVTMEAFAKEPPMPVINGEACYEGIQGTNWQDVQRFLFWTGMLSGLAGFTYGAQGVWQMSSTREPFSNMRTDWGSGFWQEAMHYPGGAQIGLGGRLLESLRWWTLRPCDFRAAEATRRIGSFAARSDDGVVLYYLPSLAVDEGLRGVRGLSIQPPEPRPVRAYFVDPRSLRRHQVDDAKLPTSETWIVPEPPSREDWLLITESETPSTMSPI